jgi:hypothetical protein
MRTRLAIQRQIYLLGQGIDEPDADDKAALGTAIMRGMRDAFLWVLEDSRSGYQKFADEMEETDAGKDT